MFDVDAFVQATSQLWSLSNLAMMVIGVAVGIVVGVLPGLNAPLAIALALPFTFFLSAEASFALLLGVYNGGTFGGSITAVTLGIPGTASAAATVLDGHAMFRKGRGGLALMLALIASVFGGLVGSLVLMFLAPILGAFAMRFGPAEYFALGVFGVSVIGLVSGGGLLKGLLMGMLGIFLTTIGIDPVSGSTRFTFGAVNLYRGIPLIPILVGMFALPELMERAEHMAQRKFARMRVKVAWPERKLLWREKFNLMRSAVIGTLVGIMPGEGAAIGSFVSYGVTKRAAKDPASFGRGSEAGVVAAETANNATVGGALVPTLTLGIPGSPAAAVLLGALLVHGLEPGPRLFIEAPNLIYFVFAAMLLIQFIMLGLGRIAIGWAVQLVKVPDGVLIPSVLLLAFVGSYAALGSIYGVLVAVVSGIAGYVFRRYGFPVIPIVLGLVLGSMIEVNFRQSLTLSAGSYMVFLERPVTATIFAATFLLLSAPALGKAAKWLGLWRKRRGEPGD